MKNVIQILTGILLVTTFMLSCTKDNDLVPIPNPTQISVEDRSAKKGIFLRIQNSTGAPLIHAQTYSKIIGSLDVDATSDFFKVRSMTIADDVPMLFVKAIVNGEEVYSDQHWLGVGASTLSQLSPGHYTIQVTLRIIHSYSTQVNKYSRKIKKSVPVHFLHLELIKTTTDS